MVMETNTEISCVSAIGGRCENESINPFQTGLEDATRALKRGKVKDVAAKETERANKCDAGDAYSCGVAEALQRYQKLLHP